ncbi:hypothetical protein GCM10009660_30080 [Catellatospora bangladeshensis]
MGSAVGEGWKVGSGTGTGAPATCVVHPPSTATTPTAKGIQRRDLIMGGA